MSTPTIEQINAALATVNDPEIKRPITDLGMVDAVEIDDAGVVSVKVLLTVAGCPLKDTINRDVTAAVQGVDGVNGVDLELGVMTPEQRAGLKESLSDGQAQREIPFAQPGSLTKVFAVASGKGGVGKSSVTVNLAVALAEAGHVVGVMDADIYGYSVPRMLGVSGKTYGMEGLVFPLRSYGCKVVSIGFFLPDPDRPVMWRGPMMHRALQQFLSDVYWGDLDFLLIDLPPGTGDIAISLGQMLPDADMLVVTTPQEAAQKVAARAGQMAEETGMHVAGVVENMASFTCPDCGSSHDIFGSGGGATLAEELGTQLLARVPIDPRLREGGDRGVPIVVGDPDAPAARALRSVAETVARRSRSVVGKSLPLVGGG